MAANGPVVQKVNTIPTLPKGNFTAVVKANEPLCTEHFRLTLSIRRFAATMAGQFVQLECSDPFGVSDHDAGPSSFEWPPASMPVEGECAVARPVTTDGDFQAPLPFLRRPFSIARHSVWPDGYSEIDIIHRVVGKGTLRLSQLRPGQAVTLLGPLGNGFRFTSQMEHACLVGGGVGIPPMLFLAARLATNHFKNVTAFVGAQRHDLLPLHLASDADPPVFASADGEPLLTVEEFSQFNYPTAITTDDGSLGMKGYVTDALRKFLQERLEENGHLNKVVVYCCGPTPMMKATARVAAAFGVECQVSLEQPMACGMGTCQSCIIKWRPMGGVVGGELESSADAWKYKLTCTDGPVFDSRELLW